MSFFCIRKDLNVSQSPRWAAEAFALKIKRSFNNVCQHSLQVQTPEAEYCPDCHGRERTSLLTSYKWMRGSLTIEAALAMTLFLFAVLSLLSFFFVIRTEIHVQTALEQTGNQLAALPETASIATATMLFQEKLLENKVDDSMIEGGQLGISLADSTVMGHNSVIDLVAVYRVVFPFFPDDTAEYKIIQRSRKQAFGDAQFLSSENKSYVYVTPNGDVYHESMYCTYIRPLTEEISLAEAKIRKNRNGETYEECSFCYSDGDAPTVWITQWGDCYHLSEHCRGIWHDVERVSVTEVSDRRACSKCVAGKQEG